MSTKLSKILLLRRKDKIFKYFRISIYTWTVLHNHIWIYGGSVMDFENLRCEIISSKNPNSKKNAYANNFQSSSNYLKTSRIA